MDENSGANQELLPFRAVLTAHRSLPRVGFKVLMAAVGGVSLVLGMGFLMLGAWPVFGFFGLDVLLVYLAFELNYRAGRLYETVELVPQVLTVTRVHRGSARLVDRGRREIRSHDGRGVPDAEEDQGRRHERPAAHAGQADDHADEETGGQDGGRVRCQKVAPELTHRSRSDADSPRPTAR